MSQVFFAGPEEDRLSGRVLLGRGPLAGAAYPLYFCVDLRPSVVPGALRAAHAARHVARRKLQAFVADSISPVDLLVDLIPKTILFSSLSLV